jgi:sialidase-1
LQGPGKGISLKDGTLVFPAQFKDKEQMPHSTIIWSKDHGKTWNIGTGAKSNTTEAQVIELNDGGLMLNMRDNRNGADKSETNGRAVAVTYDLGKTWKTHATSNGALKEPTCMASLIKEDFLLKGKTKSVVLFSNPDSKSGRHHITIKVSLDDAQTWPERYHRLIDSGSGRGYSCMTKIDDKHFGILYEGSQADLIFQKFSIDEILKK